MKVGRDDNKIVYVTLKRVIIISLITCKFNAKYLTYEIWVYEYGFILNRLIDIDRSYVASIIILDCS